MMHGQKKRTKRIRMSSPSTDEDSRKENADSGMTSKDSRSVISKRSRSERMSRTSSRQQFGKMIELMERHEKFQAELLQEQRKANETHERVSIQLLDILRQSLLSS